MKATLSLVALLVGSSLISYAKPSLITFIRARSVGNTDIAKQILYVRVPDNLTDAQIEKLMSPYAAQELKSRQLDQVIVWIDLQAAINCEKLSGKPYFTYSYPPKTLKPGFASRKVYLDTVADLRAKGSCKALY